MWNLTANERELTRIGKIVNRTRAGAFFTRENLKSKILNSKRAKICRFIVGERLRLTLVLTFAALNECQFHRQCDDFERLLQFIYKNLDLCLGFNNLIIVMRILVTIVLGAAAAVVLPTISLKSCAERASIDKVPEAKLQKNDKGILIDLMREEKAMLDRCAEGSARLALATAIIAEGCGLENESQKLLAQAKAPNKSSANEDQIKNFTDEPPELKMPEYIRGILMDLMREEKNMLTRCSEGSARLAQATAIIAEGCDLEKEAQKLRACANALNNDSSNEDQKKNIADGWNLVADVNQLIVSAANATVQSKEKFKLGYVQKCEAEHVLNQVALREIPAAMLKAAAIGYYISKNKESLKSDPIAAVQIGVALNYSLLPLRIVAKNYKNFQK